MNGVHWKQHLQMLDLLLPIGLYLQEVLEDNLTIQDMSVEPIGTLLTLLSIGLLRRPLLRMRAYRALVSLGLSTAPIRRSPTGFVPSGVLPIELCTLILVLCNGFFYREEKN